MLARYLFGREEIADICRLWSTKLMGGSRNFRQGGGGGVPVNLT